MMTKMGDLKVLGESVLFPTHLEISFPACTACLLVVLSSRGALRYPKYDQTHPNHQLRAQSLDCPTNYLESLSRKERLKKKKKSGSIPKSHQKGHTHVNLYATRVCKLSEMLNVKTCREYIQ